MWAYSIYVLMKAEFGNQQILNQTVQFGLIVCYFVLDYIYSLVHVCLILQYLVYTKEKLFLLYLLMCMKSNISN